MMQESTPTLSFVVPWFNILIQTLERIVGEGQGFLCPSDPSISHQVRGHMGIAAQAGIDKIKDYYKKLAKIPALAISTSECINCC